MILKAFLDTLNHSSFIKSFIETTEFVFKVQVLVELILYIYTNSTVHFICSFCSQRVRSTYVQRSMVKPTLFITYPKLDVLQYKQEGGKKAHTI